MSNLLIVDDEESICWGLSKIVKGLGHTPIAKPSAEAALQLSTDASPVAIVLDVRLPGISGLEAICQLRDRFGDVPIIVITAHGDLETAVDTVRNGAFEYVVKPFETEQIRELIERAIDNATTRQASAVEPPPPKIDGMSGKSRVMQEVFTRIALAANTNAGVLIQGESGTGKELAARAVHRYSNRADGPFVAVNVAALSASLAESEMFGHVRGAFTGAAADRAGLLQQANGGTLFLDEVGEIPLEMQIKLLRALEHGVFTPVGESEPITSDFRIVSATNADLTNAIQSGTFRHDLFYRLSAFRIDIPPLRERDNDAVLLARQFATSLGGGAQIFSDSTEQEVASRPWHGNVRELRNAIEHALAVSRGGRIEPHHLPQPLALSVVAPLVHANPTLSDAIQSWVESRLANGDAAADINQELLAMAEEPLVKGTLARHNGNFSAAAKDLGIHRTTLRKKADDMAGGPIERGNE